MASPALGTVLQQANETQDNEEYDLRDQLLVGVMERRFRHRFHQNFPQDPNDLCIELQNYEKEIKDLRKRKIIKDHQYDLLLPSNKTTVDSEYFDVTLLGVLLKNLCNIKRKSREYKIIEDILNSRNKVNHSSKQKLSENSFNEIFNAVEQPLLDLGATQSELDHVKTVRMIDKQTKEKIKRIQESNIAFNYNYFPPVGNFFSRDAEIKELHRKLTNSKDPRNQKMGVVLSGFGGIGKTETCREYWRRYKAVYENIIIWINCESSSSMEKAFYDIANRCEMNWIRKADRTYIPIEKVVYLVYDHFSKPKDGQTNRKVLFIMDNLNELNIISKFLPTSSNVSPYILITSQCKYWGNQFEVLPMDVFSEAESVQFMQNNLIGSEKNAGIIKLVRCLSYHPLALQQAISYMKNNYIAISDYLRLLEKRKEELLAEPPDENENHSVYTTLSLALTKLQEKRNQNSLHLLSIMAHLDGKDIQKSLLLNFVENDLYLLNSALTMLQKYSFINISHPKIEKAMLTQTVTIHSLTQSFICIQQRKNGTFQNTLQTIARYFREDIKKRISDNQLRLLGLWYHHFIHIYEKNEESKNTLIADFFNEQNLLFQFFEIQGNYQKAKTVFEQMHALQTETNAVEKDLMIAKLWIANSLTYLKMYDDALTIYRKIKKLFLHTIGDHSELYLATKQNIACCLMNNGKYDDALSIFQEVKRVRLQTVGDRSESYLTTKHNIAHCLMNKGKYDDALSIFQEVERVRLQTVGDQSESYLTTKHEIARCLVNKGKYDDALSIFKEVEKVCLQTVGDKSESYLITKQNIARCLVNKTKYDDALSIFQEVEKVYLQTGRYESESYLTTKHGIARCLVEIGKYNDALTIFKEIKEKLLKNIRDQSQLFLKTKYNIARCLFGQGRYNDALLNFCEVEKAAKEHVEENHPYLLRTKHRIANCFEKNGKIEAALRLYKEVESFQLEKLGNSHPHYLETLKDRELCQNAQKQ